MHTPRIRRNRKIGSTLFYVLLLNGLAGLAPAAMAQQAVDTGLAEVADARRYAVEIILFAYADDVATGRETFPPDAPADDSLFGAGPPPGADGPVREYGDRIAPLADEVEDAAPLEEIPLPGTLRLQLLTDSQLTMQGIYDKLAALDAYRPVLWAGWTQAAYERNATPEIHLHRLGSVPENFDGTLSLYVSRFLHLVVDLSMRAPQSAATAPPVSPGTPQDYGLAGSPMAPATHFRIRDDRIMKSDELRYFDHPKFGLLAKVTRLEPATARNAGPAANQGTNPQQ